MVLVACHYHHRRVGRNGVGVVVDSVAGDGVAGDGAVVVLAPSVAVITVVAVVTVMASPSMFPSSSLSQIVPLVLQDYRHCRRCH